MDILLNLNEKSYENALLRGLSEISAGVCVNCAPDDSIIKTTDVIITDDKKLYSDNYRKSLFIIPASFVNNEMCVEKEHLIDPTATVSEIYKRTISLFEELTGCNYCSGLPGTAVSINFSSVCGGTGATSAALTLGRLLVAKRSKRVVYITDKAEAGFEPYLNYVDNFLRPSSELDYLLSMNTNQNEKLISIRNYMATDEFGLTIVKAGVNIHEIIRQIRKSKEFDYVITDACGLKDDPTEGSLQIKVSSRRDMRCRETAPNFKTSFFSSSVMQEKEKNDDCDKKINEIGIYNFAEFDRFEGNNLYLAYDKESFERKGSKVNISLSSVFAIGLMPLLDLLERKASDGWN